MSARKRQNRPGMAQLDSGSWLHAPRRIVSVAADPKRRRGARGVKLTHKHGSRTVAGASAKQQPANVQAGQLADLSEDDALTRTRTRTRAAAIQQNAQMMQCSQVSAHAAENSQWVTQQQGHHNGTLTFDVEFSCQVEGTIPPLCERKTRQHTKSDRGRGGHKQPFHCTTNSCARSRQRQSGNGITVRPHAHTCFLERDTRTVV